MAGVHAARYCVNQHGNPEVTATDAFCPGVEILMFGYNTGVSLTFAPDLPLALLTID